MISPARAVALGFVCFWIGILAHEAAHFGAARLVFGTWTPSHVDVDDVSRSLIALPVSAGPALTATILLVCAAVATRAASPRSLWIAAAMAAGAASRFALVGPATLLARGSNDEQTIGHFLNISARALWVSEAGFSAVALWWIWRKLPASNRLQTLGSFGVAVILGWMSAFTFGRWIGLPI